MKTLIFVLLGSALISTGAQAREKVRTLIDCKATQIYRSDYEEAFSVEEYPEVVVRKRYETNVNLPSEMDQLQVQIGASAEMRDGEERISIDELPVENGEIRYLITEANGNRIMLSVLGNQGRLTSDNHSLEAKLSCRNVAMTGSTRRRGTR